MDDFQFQNTFKQPVCEVFAKNRRTINIYTKIQQYILVSLVRLL